MTQRIRKFLARSNPFDNPAVPLASPVSWAWLTGGRMSAAGIRVDPNTSLESAAVIACVKLLSESVASMPLRLYREVSETHRIETRRHNVARLLSIAPNPEQTPVVLLGVVMVQALLWGNAFVEIQRDALGYPLALWPRASWETHMRRDDDGQLVFVTTDSPSHVKREIPAEDMIHVVGMTIDGLIGHHAVHAARQAIGLALAQDRFSGHYYANSSIPALALTCDKILKPEQKSQMRQAWEQLQTADSQHRVAILDQGQDIKVLSSTAADSQLVETRKLSREDVALIYRCPLTLLGIPDKAPRATAEQQSQDFLKFTLNPWLQRIEQAFAAKLLPTSAYSIRFETRELLRGDLVSRYTAYNTGRMAGFLSVNECRSYENLPPIPGGDTYLQPANYNAVAKVQDSADSVETEDAGEEEEDQ